MDNNAVDLTMKTDQGSDKSKNTRRNFLLSATLGTAGAVAAAVAGGAKQALDVAAPVALAETAKKPRGYHVTAHVSQYYDTTRI